MGSSWPAGGFWRPSDCVVVHRRDALTKSSGRDCQSCGRFLAALGLRRALATMNHIAASDAPCREPPETVLMGQDHRSLVLVRNQLDLLTCADPAGRRQAIQDQEPIERGIGISHALSQRLNRIGVPGSDHNQLARLDRGSL